MKKLYLTRSILAFVLIGLIALNIITYFLPFYSSTYVSPYISETTETYYYLYSGYILVSPFSSMVLIVPIIAIAFLLTDFKASKPLAFAFTASQFMSNILLILSAKSYIADRVSGSDTYHTAYGYYLCIGATVLLAMVLIALVTIHIVIKFESKADAQPQPIVNKHNSVIDNFKERIAVLDELKQSGVLTDSEYEQKRNEIVQELKV